MKNGKSFLQSPLGWVIAVPLWILTLVLLWLCNERYDSALEFEGGYLLIALPILAGIAGYRSEHGKKEEEPQAEETEDGRLPIVNRICGVLVILLTLWFGYQIFFRNAFSHQEWPYLFVLFLGGLSLSFPRLKKELGTPAGMGWGCLFLTAPVLLAIPLYFLFVPLPA